ncbi:hypothetical protein T4D_14092 [Trichinella pseudospiralis]|uniref:Uncharacterized protein n=1 Tax=Trichinella pseudospiralis TaxID=6337 RepID=A0A0V1FZ27_TRIPS|nr:hypothetical protein T4D_14092 [Trichinella pseudospiralis]
MKTFNVLQERRTVNSSLQTLKQATIELTNAEKNNNSAMMRCNMLKCWGKISQSINTGHVH